MLGRHVENPMPSLSYLDDTQQNGDPDPGSYRPSKFQVFDQDYLVGGFNP